MKLIEQSAMTKKSGQLHLYDYIIVGGGPGGLQVGYYLEKGRHDYLILEAGSRPGTFLQKFPRHRSLISINKVYTGCTNPEINLRWDWNSLLSDDYSLLFKSYSLDYFPQADDVVRYLDDYVKQFKLRIKYRAKVVRITKNSHFRIVDDRKRVYRCKRLIVAVGFTQPYLPNIPGIELTENYFHVPVNPENFINQRVFIIGKGNSAFETAENITGTASAIHLASPNSITMAWRTHYVGNLRAVNNNLLDTYQLKSQNAVLDADIEKIVRKNGKFVVTVRYKHAQGEKEDLVYDRVITCTGFRFDPTIFDQKIQPRLTIDDKFPEQTSEWESTNIKDLYFAGTLTHARDYRKTTSGFIHGFRYNARDLFRILEKKYHQKPWPYKTVKVTPEEMTEAVLTQVNTSSALWQQFGFLCDLIIVSKKSAARYYEALPIDYIHDSGFGRSKHYYTVTLEYGPHHVFADPFRVERIARDNSREADKSHFLHPVIRRYSGSKLVSEHHIIEDLAAEWKEDVHIRPLLGYFQKELSHRSLSSSRKVMEVFSPRVFKHALAVSST